MVVVEYTYEDMRKLIDLPKDRIISSLSELGAPSEWEPEVGKIITELTPNRPDWYSMEGLARALKAYHRKGHPRYSAQKSKYVVRIDQSVGRVRPYTVCAVVKGLELTDERVRDMVLLQEKLIGTLGRRVKKFGLGLYPLKAIKFPVSYTTMRPGDIRYVPLGHETEMGADEILENHKKGQQYGHLIRGHDRYPVFSDAEGKIMALIPIVNSAETGRIGLDTKDVFIEVSGTDLNACKAALNILVCTFADMGGTICEISMDYGAEKFVSPDLRPKVLSLDLKKVNRILGLDLKESEAADLLSRMGYEYSKGKAAVPPYRADVMGVVDIVEDIAIAFGYNNFVPTLPGFFTPGEAARRFEDVDNVLRGMGFMEMKTFILTNKEKLDLIGGVEGALEISNPKTSEFTVVRPTLLSDILQVFGINKMKGLPQKFYEIGTIYQEDEGRKRVVFGIMDKKVDFSEIRGYLQTLSLEKGFGFSLNKSKTGIFEPEISCQVLVDGKVIGSIGKVRADILQKFGIGFDVYLCELEL